jgi:hypothetical protein
MSFDPEVIPDLIPPLYTLYYLPVFEFSEIPFNYNCNGSFSTFSRKEEVAKVKKVTETTETTEEDDNFYLKMTTSEFNEYTKHNPIDDDYRKLLRHKRRKIKNCGYSKTARLKKKLINFV